MKLLRDCFALLLVAGGVYVWTHRPAPLLAPAISGARPDLAMPAAPALAPKVGSSMLVLKEGAGDGQAHLGGKPARERPLGESPRLLGASAVDITGGRVREPLSGERSPWSDRLRQPWAMGAVVALFFVLYALLARALRKGPGGRGFTHD